MVRSRLKLMSLIYNVYSFPISKNERIAILFMADFSNELKRNDWPECIPIGTGVANLRLVRLPS